MKTYLDTYYEYNTSWHSNFKDQYKQCGKNPKSLLEQISNPNYKAPKRGLLVKLWDAVTTSCGDEAAIISLETKLKKIKDIKNQEDLETLEKDIPRVGTPTMAKRLDVSRLKLYLSCDPESRWEIISLAALHENRYINLRKDSLSNIKTQRDQYHRLESPRWHGEVTEPKKILTLMLSKVLPEYGDITTTLENLPTVSRTGGEHGNDFRHGAQIRVISLLGQKGMRTIYETKFELHSKKIS